MPMEVIVKFRKEFLPFALCVDTANRENTESGIPKSYSYFFGVGFHNESVMVRHSGPSLAFRPRVDTCQCDRKHSWFLLRLQAHIRSTNGCYPVTTIQPPLLSRYCHTHQTGRRVFFPLVFVGQSHRVRPQEPSTLARFFSLESSSCMFGGRPVLCRSDSN
jgi:hypothetical protein